MLDLRTSEIAAAVSGRLVGPDVTVRDVVIDSRRVREGSLFFALRGTRTDGHRFVEDALTRGAAAAVVLSRRPAGAGARVVVADPGAALLELARHHRRRLCATVVGITGSVGKTTTKDLLAAILGGRRVVSSPRSFNNEIGVPLTIFEADAGTDALVAEIGAGAGGEIAALCEVARPHIGIVTAVGPAHLETFGSLEAIARAKAELVEALASDGLSILNADDAIVASFGDRTSASVLTYGRAPEAMVRARDVRLNTEGRASFEVRHEGRSTRVHVPLVGEHLITPALAAIACGLALGVPIEEAADRLSRARTSPGRMRDLRAAGGIRVLDDSCNANPMSMIAGLRAAAVCRGGGAAIAVLGRMEQLGEVSRREHERVGRIAAELRFDRVLAVGPGARPILDGALAAGMPPGRLRSLPAPALAAEAIRRVARPGDVVFVKASRAAGLERVVHDLRWP